MKILLVHQNFPGQFKHLLPALLLQGHEVDVFTMNDFAGRDRVRVHRYTPAKATAKDVHPWLAEFETKVIRGDAAYLKAVELRAAGYTPDLIVAHPGWGESLFLKEVWPHTKLLVYCEFFYANEGTDVGFALSDATPTKGLIFNILGLCRIKMAIAPAPCVYSPVDSNSYFAISAATTIPIRSFCC